MKKVAIQGTKGSFHEEAAYKYFGNEIETLECDTFKLTCEKLKSGEADYVMMAIENSIAGSLLPNYALLRDYHFSIVGEVYLNIQLHLLALPGVKLEEIKHVESHPIALRQVSDYLEEHPTFKVSEGMDTASCAKKIVELQLRDTAAVANKLAAELYGLQIIDRRIETIKKNFTRFLVLARHEMADSKETKANKASLLFQTDNSVGALAKILQLLAEESINMSKIQSMPVLGKRNEYDFYVDVEWKKKENYDRAITKVLKHTINFNILGEYSKNEKV
ncbi:prephenate dehydratase [Olivibacter sitiensis]|uniref:prephenate dehydratase n=1 Tax=Olivibacter sitiensis TaxID=376470 RepID=UPI000403713F|nr:prephenate dehydratase [Olivibacter sitiensis]